MQGLTDFVGSCLKPFQRLVHIADDGLIEALILVERIWIEPNFEPSLTHWDSNVLPGATV